MPWIEFDPSNPPPLNEDVLTYNPAYEPHPYSVDRWIELWEEPTFGFGDRYEGEGWESGDWEITHWAKLGKPAILSECE